MNGREYLAILAKRWATIVLCLSVCLIAAAGIGLLTPTRYAAQTQVFVSTQVDGANLNQQLFQGGSFTSDRVKSYTELVASPRVTGPVINQLALPVSPSELAGRVTAEATQGTVLINIQVTDRAADQAARIADAVAERLSQVIQELESPPGAPVPPVRAAIVTPAIPPESPVLPNWPLTLALGLLAGIVIGVGAAVLRDTMDTSLETEQDLERVSGATNLGKIVFEQAAEGPISERDSRSEAFRQLRTNLQFSSIDSSSRLFVVTSAVPAEGKSTVTGSLGVALAQIGLRVTIVDADLRHPSLAEYFGLTNDVGLTTVAIGRTTLDVALQGVRPNLWLLSSGPRPPDPSEFLATGRVSAVLEDLASRSDVVLVDTAPVIPVADTRVLAPQCDGVLLVVHAGSTDSHQVKEAVDSLRKVQATVLGTVLNRVAKRDVDDSYYGHYGTPSGDPSMTVAPTPAPSPVPAPNGHAANGHAVNGHVANGHMANGHAANGHGAHAQPVDDTPTGRTVTPYRRSSSDPS
ncbi:polysaccharide biosynthesis tyrosine autokinase [Actinomycetospora aeridis]|uniref:Polysaccharide biosynthesis tyrosine autokinase n=1 Tax=Actinomycetospora aeridis TaxID=3129231 RepID=A0ABU8N699_9PSEU